MVEKKTNNKQNIKVKESIKLLKEKNYIVYKNEKSKFRKQCAMQLSDTCKNDISKGGRLLSYFYKNTSGTFFKTTYVPICKDCIKQYVYDKNNQIIEEKFKKILQVLDIPFFTSEFKSAVESNKDTVGRYFTSVALNHQGKSWIDGDFDYFNRKNKKNDLDDNDIPIYDEFWCGKFNKRQKKFLDKYYKDLNEDFNIVTTNHKDYAKKVAKASLLVDMEYEKLMNGKGSLKSYKDAKDAFDALCNSAQFSESRRTKTDISNGISDIDNKVENNLWVYEPEEFKEDGLDHLLSQFKNIDKSL